MRFEVLGPLRVSRGERELDLGFPQQRALLGLLLVQAGRPVGTGEIVDTLWGEEASASAVNVVRRYVGALRRLLEPDLPPRAPGRRLLRRSGGYLLDVREEEVDLLRFRGLTRRARRAVSAGRPDAAVGLFADALSQWRGPVAMGIPESVRAHVVFTAVGHELVQATQSAADAALLCGRAEDVLRWVRRAVVLDPLNEPLHARLVMTTAAAGLQAEALSAYEDIRRRLVEELGVSPGPELREAHGRVLRQELWSADFPQGPKEPEAGSGPFKALARPAQLPADLAVFAGRRTELTRLRDLTHAVTAPKGPPAAILISGMAGVGKTTLAVRWAHETAKRFPDGQFYVDLRGFDPSRTAMKPEEALSAMVEALGVPPRRIPSGMDALAGLYRSLLTRRRVLVLLENACDPQQVLPLLPSSPGCLTLVTSRNTLPGLIASGAHPLRLEPPSPTDAHSSLALRTGAERLAAEPEAADEIIARCGRLPLALAIVAARAQTHRGFPLAAIAAELRDSHGSLDAFSGGGTADARAAFTCSYRLLQPDSARLFRLLSLHPGPDITARAAAALTALPVRRTRAVLGELAGAHLLTEPASGRYGMHDLLRVFAAELTEDEDTPATRHTAQHRMFDHYLHTAYAADQLLSSNKNALVLIPAQPDALPESFPDPDRALAWFTAERTVLTAVAAQALDTGFLTHGWQLPSNMDTFCIGQGRLQDRAAAHRTGVEAARREGNLTGRITTLRKLARALADLEQFEESRAHLDLAFEAADELGDPMERGHTHAASSWLLQQQGSYREALVQSEAARRIFRDAGHRASEGIQVNNMAWSHLQLGDHEKAIVRAEEAIHLLRTVGKHHSEAFAWDTLASAHHELGEFERAISCFRRAVEMLARQGDWFTEAGAWERLGDTHNAAGDLDAARTA
ncbi:tetratricopeptide repeat protein [Streptomyces sp. NBC_01275]|uniref:AfsR/SARP family transcriptional regulator n=1 Tax=Streptomyces sp. NBC_01275 TaxID=2903807 RepID=UPI00224CBA0C|nr:BTAD domain-containing putative transcriptional regulator [Streptomyces sp. NBC_01275]MCX4766807.1 tetratricopeptide repeat protein [Streptomyces sp. NBC_01275]